MKETVAILLALGIGFGLGYVVGGMGIERVEGDPYTSFENKPDAESRARAGSSESGDLSHSADTMTNQRSSDDAPNVAPPLPVEGQRSEASDEPHQNEPAPPDPLIEPVHASHDSERQLLEERVAQTRARTESPDSGQEEASDGEALRTQIQDEFARIRVSLRECYELLLQLEPTAADRLVFMLLIESDPEDIEGSLVTLDGIRSDALELDDVSCFADIAGELQLPPPTGQDPYRVSYPVILVAE